MVMSYIGEDTLLLGDPTTTASINSLLTFACDSTSTDTAGFIAAIQATWELVLRSKVSHGW